ncbi:MAG: hypothetical protein HDT28_00845 [Clostridiales bacterium]|nr:hypothetical protein [Clostridiales bacterium]
MLDGIKNYFANFNGATNACRTIALWITIALVVAFIANKLYLFIAAKRDKTANAETLAAATKLNNGAWIVTALVYAVCMIVTFTTCFFIDDSITPILFYPLLVLIIAVVGSGIALFVKNHIITKIVTASVCGAALVAVIVCMAVYYASGDAGEAFSNLGLYLSAVIITAAIVVFAFLADRKSGQFDTRAITFGAVCIALSFALSYVRIFKMPMGGSITFASMLPLMLFAYMFGCKKGVLAGVIYGVLQAVQDPWIIHPAQFALDYAVAFAGIGLTGCMRDLGVLKGNMRAQFAVGAVIACAFRFLCHYFAGVFAFGMYGESFAAEYNMPILANAYFYSFVYQCMYIIPELVLVLVVSMIVMTSKSFRRQIEIYSSREKTEKPVSAEPAETEPEVQN